MSDAPTEGEMKARQLDALRDGEQAIGERLARLERRVDSAVANLDKAIISLGRVVHDLEGDVRELEEGQRNGR